MIIETDDLKEFLKITNDESDDFLEKCILWAQGIIESHCKRTFEEAEYTAEEYTGDGSGILYLRQYPLVEVTAITIDDAAMSDVGSDCVKLNARTGAVYLVSAVFTKKDYPNVQITYTAGYSSDDMPEEIRYAVIELAALIWKESTKGDGRLGMNSEMVSEAGSNQFLHKMNPMTLKGISKYRRIAI